MRSGSVRQYGPYSPALGSTRLLDNNKYFFCTGFVPASAVDVVSQIVEVMPIPATTAGTQVLSIQTPLVPCLAHDQPVHTSGTLERDNRPSLLRITAVLPAAAAVRRARQD